MPAPAAIQPQQGRLRVAVLGAGAWGTALAAAAARLHPTLLWARDAAHAAAISSAHENIRYLPGVRLPATLGCTDSMDAVYAHLRDGDQALIILGVPVAGLQAACAGLALGLPAHGLGHAAVAWTCKGFEADTGRLPHEVVAQALAAVPALGTGVLSGPSFAREVAQGLPVALTIASPSADVRELAMAGLHGGNVRVYASQDVVGVEVGGAVKNVIAIACGIADGLDMGANARAALVTRGLAEMTRLGVALGAQAETFAGLTGLGDLVLTTTGDLSRNRRAGLEIGRGRPLADILAGGMTAEGVRCARATLQRARALGVDMPITEAVSRVLFENLAPRDAVQLLLGREAGFE